MNGVLTWLREGSHALMIVLAIGTVITFLFILKFKDKVRIHPAAAFPAAIIHSAWGVFCVKIFAGAENGNITDLSMLSIFGATFFMPLLFFAYAKIGKRNMADVFDVGTITMVFTLLLSRFNCLIEGCCTGIPFFGMANFRWPTRELEIVFYAVLLTVLIKRTIQNKSNGLNYPIYMMAYGAFRFFVEFVRDNGNHLFHRSHIWAVLSFCLGISIYAEIKNKNTKKEKKSKIQKNRR